MTKKEILLRNALVKLVGVDGKIELLNMKKQIELLDIPDTEDSKEVSLYAIDALIETL
jgi:hypothetical protein